MDLKKLTKDELVQMVQDLNLEVEKSKSTTVEPTIVKSGTVVEECVKCFTQQLDSIERDDVLNSQEDVNTLINEISNLIDLNFEVDFEDLQKRRSISVDRGTITLNGVIVDGAMVRALRHELNLSQRGLAVQLGLSQQSSTYISDVENGRSRISAKHLEKMLRMLDY